MTAFAARVTDTIEGHSKLVAGILGGVILFFLAACLFHDIIPICHWLFHCDHRLH